MSRPIYDISPPVGPRLAVWPGDTPPEREVLMDMGRGDHLTLSTLHATVHLGAHADAPSHYGATAPAIDERDLTVYLGPCQLVRADVAPGERITPDAVTAPVTEDRVLFATGTFPDCTQFREDFAGVDPTYVHALADRGVRLVGIDTPSVDVFHSRDLPAHRACLERDVSILEGLVLDHVPTGRYELIALPLRLVGFDASPVRAVLRPL